MFSAEEKQFIKKLARDSIEYYLQEGKNLEIDISLLPGPELKAKRSCFVTLELAGDLRGCIGHIEPIQPLYLDIIENAAAAAFTDPRFMPLTAEELDRIKIEVSVLTSPEPLVFNNADELKNKLRSGVDGVIIQQGSAGATYLPQVWEDLPDKEQFLSSLCQKAGLSSDCWKSSDLKVFTYQVEVID